MSEKFTQDKEMLVGKRLDFKGSTAIAKEINEYFKNGYVISLSTGRQEAPRFAGQPRLVFVKAELVGKEDKDLAEKLAKRKSDAELLKEIQEEEAALAKVGTTNEIDPTTEDTSETEVEDTKEEDTSETEVEDTKEEDTSETEVEDTKEEDTSASTPEKKKMGRPKKTN